MASAPPLVRTASSMMKSEDTALAEALDKLSACSLQNERVVSIRNGGSTDADGDGVPDDLDIEPPMNTRAEAKEWRKWAKVKAKEYADTVHPRLEQKDGPPKPLPILRFRPNDILEQVGIVPALYLDFMKFGGGYCLLGLLFAAVPSIVLNAMHAKETYPDIKLDSYPHFFLYLSVGARAYCESEVCKNVNFATAVLEALYSILLLLGIRHFRRRAAKLQELNDANNVYTREYAVQLHGMPKNCTAEDVKKHVEECLRRHGNLTKSSDGGGGAPYSVWDVSLITDCATVLNQAVKQAPLERKWTLLDRRLKTLLAFKKEKDTGWELNQKIAVVRQDTEDTADKLLAVRRKMGTKGTKGVTKVKGAFVTFEEQPARRACLKLFGGHGAELFGDKKGLKMRGRRLCAYPAPEPREVLHENLPYRILNMDMRALFTMLRRVTSKTLLGLFMLLSFGTIIVMNTLKDAVAEAEECAATPSPPPSAPSAPSSPPIEQCDSSAFGLDPSVTRSMAPAFTMLVPAFVVGVNQAIIFLVGALGKFERHPTLSGMHRSKVVTIFLGVAFNTGMLPLIVSAAPPPSAYADLADSCECDDPYLGLFCCAIGPNGVFLRGKHVTMSATWHAEVGILFVQSLFLQALLGLFLWAAPYAVFGAKKLLKAGGVVHKFDMEALYTGPEIDLPKFIGKAYAFALITFAYAAVLPILYAIGVLFFFGTWFCERYALLRVHRTPPPYSFELITSTLGWMPWAVVLHLFVAFFGFASLPSLPMSGQWVRPFDEPPPGINGTVDELAFLGGGAAAASNLLEHAYDLGGHVNSWPTCILAALFVCLLAWLIFLILRATPLYLPLQPLEAALYKAALAGWRKVYKPTARVVPDGLEDGTLDGEDIIDPPFSVMLEGKTRNDVRIHEGAIVHEFQTKYTRTLREKLNELTPSSMLFGALGMRLAIEPVTLEEWNRATPVYTHLSRAADISYQPEFHPTYEKAFVYMSDPKQLACFIAASDQEEARKNRGPYVPEGESFLSEEESEEEAEEESDSDSDEAARKPNKGGNDAPAKPKASNEVTVQELDGEE